MRGPAPSEISEMSKIANTFGENRGEARAFGMTMSLIIKYLQENRELRMRIRMRIGSGHYAKGKCTVTGTEQKKKGREGDKRRKEKER